MLPSADSLSWILEEMMVLYGFGALPYQTWEIQTHVSTKTRCRASERLAAVVTFQTFYRGKLKKRFRNKTLVSSATPS
jgi:hypothetical protein